MPRVHAILTVRSPWLDQAASPCDESATRPGPDPASRPTYNSGRVTMDRLERHFERDLETLTEEILRLGGLAQEAIAGSLKALTRRDSDLARQVIAGDEAIDQQELVIDQICM